MVFLLQRFVFNELTFDDPGRHKFDGPRAQFRQEHQGQLPSCTHQPKQWEGSKVFVRGNVFTVPLASGVFFIVNPTQGGPFLFASIPRASYILMGNVNLL